MRLISAILLILMVFKTSAQNDSVVIMTVEDAVALALQKNTAIQSESDRKTLVRDIKSVWYLWLFQLNKLRVLQEYLAEIDDLDRVAALRYTEGDIELLEKSWFLTHLADVRTKTVLLNNDIAISRNLLQQLVNSRDSIVPVNAGLSLYQVVKGSGKEPDPSGSVNSVRLENMHLELDNFFIKLQYYESFGLDHARLVFQINRAKYEAEEIDYLEFTRSLAEAFNMKTEFLETLNNYNQTAIELEHYAY
jgi:outer membrane protein TolC